jgi:Arc/MetJ family transcription regulator
VRTTIEIDERLIHRVMRITGLYTKKATIEAGLRLLAETHSEGAIRQLKKKMDWQVDPDRSRAPSAQKMRGRNN